MCTMWFANSHTFLEGINAVDPHEIHDLAIHNLEIHELEIQVYDIQVSEFKDFSIQDLVI